MYNSTEHSITQIKPNEAGKKRKPPWGNWHLQNAAKRNYLKKHTGIKDGDVVGYKLNQVLGLRVMNQNGVRHDIVLLETQLIINITFQV